MHFRPCLTAGIVLQSPFYEDSYPPVCDGKTTNGKSCIIRGRILAANVYFRKAKSMLKFRVE